MESKEMENSELREEIEVLKRKLAKKDKEYIDNMAESQNNLNERIKQISLHYHNREQNLLKNYNNLLNSKKQAPVPTNGGKDNDMKIALLALELERIRNLVVEKDEECSELIVS